MTEIEIEHKKYTPTEISKLLICSILEDLNNNKLEYLNKFCKNFDEYPTSDKDKVYTALDKISLKVYKTLERFILIDKMNDKE